ncbi:uncharacterized protein LOC126558063 [Anopheles maculipalpis]|uniref:uncharacterized protein LOC126558063 n=1 Tax=Anopheles maculipalpis TaxID=1496333 RepID=UPI0021598729|nr:uncharacterized protein LOC126558063 [Anopheles maculipalpis]
MLLAVALLLSTLIPRLEGRFLEISKQPPGTVAIVPNDDDGESLLLGPPLFEDLQELDREKASEMISVKLLNQYHAKTFDVADDQLHGNDMVLDEDRPLSGRELGYEADNRLEAQGNDLVEPYVLHPSSVDPDVIDGKENGIEEDFVPTEPILDKRLLGDDSDGWMQSDANSGRNFPPSRSIVREGAKKVDSVGSARTTTTTTTLTTTSTTTRTTTVRKMMRKIRQQSVSGSSTTRPPSSTQRTHSSRSTAIPQVATTTTSHRPPVPKIDITKLNLDHLENDLLSFSTLVPPQALALASVASSTRLLPRSIKPEEMVPSCGCQHRKRSLAKNLYSSEEAAVDPVEDYDEYDDYDYNEVQKRPATRSLGERATLFPAMSRLLAGTGSSEVPESSIERAEKVHGTLERLMGIVTIFSHVDEFIQRKTKQSIRRLARLYESEELD